MNNISLLLMVVLCLLTLTISRRLLLLPFIMAACLVPMNQTLVFYTLDLTVLRLLTLAGAIRLLTRGEVRNIQWNSFDRLILAWVAVGSIVYTIQWGTFSAFINRTGFMLDCLGMYWLFRQAIQNWDDIFQAVKLFAIFTLATAPLIAYEGIQHTSFFSLFGPVVGTFHRGRFRAAGPFPHFIVMGCFYATLLPLFYARLKAGQASFFYVLATLAALANVYYSASSTPLMTVAAVIIFWSLYSLRAQGKTIFLGICCLLFFLHLIMKAPVWHLMSRVDIFSGSTGWHRYFLFDNFIKHASEWFLLGTQSTGHWGNVQDDITNQFVLEGVRGGIATLLIFIVIVYRAVKIPGQLSLKNIPASAKWMSWGICVTMLSHFISFWGISYFGQINMLLYLTLALIGFAMEQDNTLSVENSLR